MEHKDLSFGSNTQVTDYLKDGFSKEYKDRNLIVGIHKDIPPEEKKSIIDVFKDETYFQKIESIMEIN